MCDSEAATYLGKTPRKTLRCGLSIFTKLKNNFLIYLQEKGVPRGYIFKFIHSMEGQYYVFSAADSL